MKITDIELHEIHPPIPEWNWDQVRLSSGDNWDTRTIIVHRYKRIIGDRLRAQHREAQDKEALIAVSVINRMTALGMPESAKIVA